jgi:hypothetical protein
MIKSDALSNLNRIKENLESLRNKEAIDLKDAKGFLFSISRHIKQFKLIMQNKTLDTEIDEIGSIVEELLSNETLTINDKEFETHISTMLDTIENIISKTSILSSEIVHTQATNLEPKKYYRLELSGETIEAIKLASNKPQLIISGGKRKSRKSGRTGRSRKSRKLRKR